MEVALANAIAVTRLTARSFLLFFRESSSLKALLMTPKVCFPLSSSQVLPSLPENNCGLRDALQQMRTKVSVEERTFTLSGALLGGGACCTKGVGLDLEPKKPSKWSELIAKLGAAPDKQAVRAELAQLRTDLAQPSLEDFREVVDDIAKVAWKSTDVRDGVLKILMRAATQMFLASQTTGLTANSTLCERLQSSITQVRHKELTGTSNEVFAECCLEITTSALSEISAKSEGPKLPTGDEECTQSQGDKTAVFAAVKAALESADPTDLKCDDPVFLESLAAGVLPLRVVSKHEEMQGLLDTYYACLQELQWPLQALLVRRAMRLKIVDDSHEEAQKLMEAHFTPLFFLYEGQNSWKVRVMAAQALGRFLSSSAPENAKEVASSFILKALERESNLAVLSELQKLPRTYLNPSLICTALAGAGTGGVYNFRTGELLGLENALLHGTARAVASLNDTLILTGGLLNPKKCFEIDIGSGKVRELATMKAERFWHGACLVGLDIVVCGGKTLPDGDALKSAEKLVGDKWVSLPDMNYKRESHSCAGWGTVVYAVGGLGDEKSSISIEVLERETWRLLTVELPAPLLVPGIFLKSESELIIAGGRAEETLAAVQILNLTTGASEKLPDLPHPSAFSSDLVELRDNSVFLLSSESRELFKLSLDTKEWSVRGY